MAESNELIASSSQTSFVTESSPAFETPPPSSGPNCLDIIHCQGKCLVFYPKAHDDIVKFNDWWDTTPFSRRQNDNGAKFRWKSSSRKSFVWEHFDDVAEYPNGTPKVHCRHCKQIFAHPSDRNLGTHALGSHLKGPKCSSPLSITTPPASHSSIKTLLSQSVSLFSISFNGKILRYLGNA